MRNASNLLTEMRRLGLVVLSDAKGAELVLKGSKTALTAITAELRERIKQEKSDLLALLQAESTNSTGVSGCESHHPDTSILDKTHGDDGHASSETSHPAKEAQAAEHIKEERTIKGTIGGEVVQTGSYDCEATLVDAVPPVIAEKAHRAWLARIDWRSGVRCAKDGRQCRFCRGVPCENSTAWSQ